MTTYTKALLSGSTNGKQIKVGTTSTPGTLIHTAVEGVINIDEIWLYVSNSHTISVTLTLEWGGVTLPDDIIPLEIPPNKGLYLLVPGLILQNSLIVRAFANITNVLTISGYVNRITP
jgi:hypothetical protein